MDKMTSLVGFHLSSSILFQLFQEPPSHQLPLVNILYFSTPSLDEASLYLQLLDLTEEPLPAASVYSLTVTICTELGALVPPLSYS